MIPPRHETWGPLQKMDDFKPTTFYCQTVAVFNIKLESRFTRSTRKVNFLRSFSPKKLVIFYAQTQSSRHAFVFYLQYILAWHGWYVKKAHRKSEQIVLIRPCLKASLRLRNINSCTTFWWVYYNLASNLWVLEHSCSSLLFKICAAPLHRRRQAIVDTTWHLLAYL